LIKDKLPYINQWISP